MSIASGQTWGAGKSFQRILHEQTPPHGVANTEQSRTERSATLSSQTAGQAAGGLGHEGPLLTPTVTGHHHQEKLGADPVPLGSRETPAPTTPFSLSSVSGWGPGSKDSRASRLFGGGLSTPRRGVRE